METIEKSDTPTLKEQLEKRLKQLENGRKQIEAQHIEVCGMIAELKRTIALIL